MGLLADIAGALGTAAGGLGNLANTAFTTIGQNLGNAGAGLLTAYGYDQTLDDLKAFGADARIGAETIGQQAATDTRFVPFTVTGATGAGVGTTPEGGTMLSLSPAEQALQQQALGGSGQFFRQAINQQYPTMDAQTQAMNQLFAQQAGQFGLPSQLTGLTGQAYQQGQQRIGQAAQPTDINLLRGQFAGQVGGFLGQQPSGQLGQLGTQAYGMGQQALGQVPYTGAGATNLGLDIAQQGAGMLGGVSVPSQLGTLSSEALSRGISGLGQLSQPSDIETLRQQYAGLAGQAAGGLLTDMGTREQDIYQRIRAAQSPEEQRQRLALEERLAAQGRLGTSSAAYGGATPEQLAMETAQAEARNSASLAAMEQARAEQAQQLQTAQTLGGMTGQFAGISSDLQNAAQQRAAQLAQLGLSTEQIQSQLQSEGLGRGLQTLQAGLQAQEVGSGLQSQAQQRAAQLSQLGMSAEQIQSQLQSEGLGRATQAGSLAADLASTASGLETQGLQRGLSLAGLGMQGSEIGQSLTSQQLQNLLALQQSNVGSAQAQQALRQGNLGLGSGLLTSAYAPQAALLNVLQQGMGVAGLSDVGRRQAAQLQAEAEMSGLEAELKAQLARGNLTGQGIAALAGLFTGS